VVVVVVVVVVVCVCVCVCVCVVCVCGGVCLSVGRGGGYLEQRALCQMCIGNSLDVTRRHVHQSNEREAAIAVVDWWPAVLTVTRERRAVDVVGCEYTQSSAAKPWNEPVRQGRSARGSTSLARTSAQTEKHTYTPARRPAHPPTYLPTRPPPPPAQSPVRRTARAHAHTNDHHKDDHTWTQDKWWWAENHATVARARICTILITSTPKKTPTTHPRPTSSVRGTTSS
jgi:hypothetical protein